MNIYTYCFNKIAQGASYFINLPNRNLIVDHRVIIEDGQYDGDLGLAEEDFCDEDVFKHVEMLYRQYKHSIPSERSDARGRVYFRALKEEELSDDDMMYGARRMESMFNLEYYLLVSILRGTIKWEDSWGWFWQSEQDKDLVILRSWVVGE